MTLPFKNYLYECIDMVRYKYRLLRIHEQEKRKLWVAEKEVLRVLEYWCALSYAALCSLS